MIITVANLRYRFGKLNKNIAREIKNSWGDFCHRGFKEKGRYTITRNFANLWSFKTFFKKRLARDLINYNMLMLHSASFVYNGVTFLFLGESGRGKSTLVKMVENRALILNDETNIVDTGDLRVYSTPFWGDVPLFTPYSSKVSKIFVLDKLYHDVVRRLNKKDALPRILKTVLIDTESAKVKIKLFKLVLKLLQNCEFYLFSYSLNSDIFRLLLDTCNNL
ncbi:MAG: hypothetical protein ACK4NF_07045 [Planctomycetota bacterium]